MAAGLRDEGKVEGGGGEGRGGRDGGTLENEREKEDAGTKKRSRIYFVIIIF